MTAARPRIALAIQGRPVVAAMNSRMRGMSWSVPVSRRGSLKLAKKASAMRCGPLSLPARPSLPNCVRRWRETTARLPAEVRDLVSYADAYDPLADELEAFAQFLRHSVKAARNLAGSEALTTYSLAQRPAKQPRTAHLAPYVDDMRHALGRVRKASPGDEAGDRVPRQSETDGAAEAREDDRLAGLHGHFPELRFGAEGVEGVFDEIEGAEAVAQKAAATVPATAPAHVVEPSIVPLCAYHAGPLTTAYPAAASSASLH
jgi:hypothetical protein